MSNPLSSIQLGAPEDEISFRDLRAISQRFKKLHQLKRESVRHILNNDQRQFLDVLPLILNMNHPALPGFISTATPAGIFAYQPEKRSIDAARQINRSFSLQPQRRRNQNAAIDGLFLMGSVGSIAFTKASDIDIWLCHRADLTQQELDELQKKTQALEKWATSLHLEVHFFLINSKQFLLNQKTPISADSSGETQHYLLLEEFYRTSVYIAGKVLAWWLVPPHHENDYQGYLAHLLERRFINENQILDLGGLAHVPAGEFISATQWHIYKALHSPYKSLLKLSLLECYASEYPHINWLCVDIKRAVYQGKLAGLEIDPYVLIYRKLEDYLLKAQSSERLAMIRQIFCRKVTEAAGDHRQTGALSPYEDYFREISESWQWPNNLLHVPCDPDPWNIEKLLVENEAIVEQLAHCHSKIIRFAHDHIDPNFQGCNDMKLLCKKLIAFFARKPGKIEITTTRGNELPIEPILSIVEIRHDAKDSEWCLFFGKKNRQDADLQAPLYRRPTLIEMLCWLTVNGFYRQGAALHCEVESLNLMSGELSVILGHLNEFFKSHFDFSDSLSNYEGNNSLTQSLLIINIGQTPPQSEAGPYLISHRDNPLSHGARRECLVRTVDRVSISHWNEVMTNHEQGIEGLFDCLIEIVQGTPQSTTNCLNVICRTPGYAHSIIRRIEQLFEALLELHRHDPANAAPRYLLAGGDRYAVFSNQDGRLQYQWFDGEAQLIKALSNPQALYGSVAFDSEVLAQTPIPAIYQENRPHTLQCFIYQEANAAKVYILDEKGSLHIRQHQEAASNPQVNQYARFLHAVLSRKTSEATAMEFFEIKKNCAGNWSFLPLSYHLTQLQDQSDLDLPPSMFGIADADGLQTQHFLQYKKCNKTKLDDKQH
ncbi:class I adenylate cyclase [Methylomicrobium sp. Wu6]|uniref:class I adenylate cyclase n=1 Tax=Methylomicrobium sp. Wu6 TaxID=3107928 RepID=UPI002DD6B8DB|nr:class I adenylate cyclase [Methylomicrobium sp. Wu6]MEC4748422.1 class I adenylate cyclase [Methylomicrobium sp. Wu6]